MFLLSERAKAFWAKEDVDEIFDTVFEYLDHLKSVLKKNTATDKGWTSLTFDCNEQDVISFLL